MTSRTRWRAGEDAEWLLSSYCFYFTTIRILLALHNARKYGSQNQDAMWYAGDCIDNVSGLEIPRLLDCSASV
ncbi:hypothetical protein AVEN_264142-1 [Araneus ventricosus]|uniref:Uncharacterized protein n=1 Tax=Araneus ventricosus TaxID=182803 RepID=A0A4Y2HA48_ARAVE|nr:hypothetical protein AVEN_264142-1 [Araneus ventricosus]